MGMPEGYLPEKKLCHKMLQVLTNNDTAAVNAHICIDLLCNFSEKSENAQKFLTKY